MSREVYTDVLGGSYGPWQKWFAWHPIWVPMVGRRWLCFVQRRWYCKPWLPFPIASGWQYQTNWNGL